MTLSPTELRIQYIGTARLLVETHNKYLKALMCSSHFDRLDEGDCWKDEEQQEMMGMFVADFNKASEVYIIRSTGGGCFGIFERDEVPA